MPELVRSTIVWELFLNAIAVVLRIPDALVCALLLESGWRSGWWLQ